MHRWPAAALIFCAARVPFKFPDPHTCSAAKTAMNEFRPFQPETRPAPGPRPCGLALAARPSRWAARTPCVASTRRVGEMTDCMVYREHHQNYASFVKTDLRVSQSVSHFFLTVLSFVFRSFSSSVRSGPRRRHQREQRFFESFRLVFFLVLVLVGLLVLVLVGLVWWGAAAKQQWPGRRPSPASR